MNLALTTRTMGEVVVVKCGGNLTFQREATALCELITELVPKYRSVVIDMSGISSIDGSGLGTLADCIRNARESGSRLVLCAVPPKVKRLLDLTKISSLVDIEANETDALIRSRAAA